MSESTSDGEFPRITPRHVERHTLLAMDVIERAAELVDFMSSRVPLPRDVLDMTLAFATAYDKLAALEDS